jgi:hypothetical protein
MNPGRLEVTDFAGLRRQSPVATTALTQSAAKSEIDAWVYASIELRSYMPVEKRTGMMLVTHRSTRLHFSGAGPDWPRSLEVLALQISILLRAETTSERILWSVVFFKSLQTGKIATFYNLVGNLLGTPNNQ